MTRRALLMIAIEDRGEPVEPIHGAGGSTGIAMLGPMLGPFLSFLKSTSLYAYPLLFVGCYFEVLVPFSLFVPGEIFFYAGGI